jgi:hypothetical protein
VRLSVCLGGAQALLESSELKPLDALISEADNQLAIARV